MKKVVWLLFVVLILAISVSCNVFAEEYSVDEIYFDIPEDYFFECAVDEDYYLAWGFEGIYEDIKLTVVEHDNYSGEYFYHWDLQDVTEYYKENLCLYPDDYEVESIESLYLSDICDKYILEGKNVADSAEGFFKIGMFVTEDYIYILEFTSPQVQLLESPEVYHVINSVYVSSYPSDDYQIGSTFSGEDFVEFLGPVFLVIFSSFAFVFKNFVKNKKEPEKSSDTNKTQPSPVNIKLPTTKFELNGKNINAFNERFNVGSKDDNFALKELERERKEREKMFK